MKLLEELLSNPYVETGAIIVMGGLLLFMGYKVGGSIGELIWNILH